MPPKKSVDGDSKKETLRQGTQGTGADDDASASSEEGSLDIGACSLCHCALDGTDRAAFFKADREVDYGNFTGDGDDDDGSDPEEYYFRPDDPYLPPELHDPHNALVYCDTCDRLYHQKCHFVPLLIVPRGEWSCLVCQSRRSTAAASTKGTNKRKKRDSSSASENSTKDRLFTSPPQSDVRALELEWERDSAHLKALEMSQQIKRITQFCRTQLSNYRLATTAVETFTSTQRNMHHFILRPAGGHGDRPSNGGKSDATPRSSQELAQTVLKLTSSRYKLRGSILTVDAWRRGTDALRTRQRLHRLIHDSGREEEGKGKGNNSHHPRFTDDFVTRVLFPFGDSLPIRTVPRTEEVGEHDPDGGENVADKASIPSEVVLTISRRGGPSHHARHDKHDKTSKSTRNSASASATTKKDATKYDDDTDEGVSVDDLTCCICWQATATDDNDLVMCDGSGCARAYHMQCLHPHLTSEDLEQDDWFCPICTCLADLLHLVQSETLGDEWEVRRRERHAKRLPCDGSLKSWDGPEEVFPEADWEYETAQRLVKNRHDADTNRLLANVLGIDVNGAADPNQAPDDDSDEDDDDDEHFDLVEFEKEKQNRRNDTNGESDCDDSTRSSQVSLQEMSSVELGIGRDELAALSENDDDSSDDDEDGSGEASTGAEAPRKSRRLAKKKFDGSTSSSTGSDARHRGDDSDPGRLDESNILPGKRNRKPVDYRRLNDAMFGDLAEEDIANLDAGDDYLERATAASSSGKRSSSTSASSSTSSTPPDGESNSESDEEESTKSREPSKRNPGKAQRTGTNSRSATGRANVSPRPTQPGSTNAKAKKPKKQPVDPSPPSASRTRDASARGGGRPNSGTKRGRAASKPHPPVAAAAVHKSSPTRGTTTSTSTSRKNGMKRKRAPSASRT